MLGPFLSLFLLLLELPAPSTAYSWSFTSTPAQCQNLTVSVSGSDGKGPYRILIVPFGSSPFANNTEVRRILDQKFPSDSATEVTFQLNYPENSQFVAVVSDATGFGSGGTSVAAQVTSSDDFSCYNASQDVSPDFVYSIEPSNQIVQCQQTRIWWDPANVEGTPNFLGVIPGGESFTVPEGTITEVTSEGTGFSWTPSIRGGTTLLLVGGDDRGNGTAGSALFTVSSGTSNNSTCLTSDSPSSTPGTPAGGTYPTSATDESSGGNSSNGNNTGAIVGGVVGGVVGAIALLLLLWFLRRRHRQKQEKEKTVDLLHEDDGDEQAPNSAELPQYYEPEPFIIPDPTVASEDGRLSADGRPISQILSVRSGTPDIPGSTTSMGGVRKGGLRSLRPVNIIQHDDAGPSGPLRAEEEPETVELPPAYTKIRQ
ncbi:uncharacterized protein BT62DRAFT_929922 [Guyanagaster necrorhizus]|uniref:Uncharacterized protein n=1 Tax=Guyanagaster necrorhizus TaxID=856835 RepID=A0A9P8AWE1_9AGAR|nr:uncharacterized protein BT62DRAFT_929922 [Guyanagaster necrorhizus MCA 3950]KAG7448852.1 hypothetical protein BT62DRAFT_929922 [Guyanagaster necrorhizus MCA 3950]